MIRDCEPSASSGGESRAEVPLLPLLPIDSDMRSDTAPVVDEIGLFLLLVNGERRITIYRLLLMRGIKVS